MASLIECGNMQQRLKKSKKSLVVKLHKFVFQSEGDRKNRDRLRQFQGFTYNENDVEYNEKCQYVKNNLTEADLMSICKLLGLDHNGDNLVFHIFNNLCKNNLLKDTGKEDTDDAPDNNVGDEANRNKAPNINQNINGIACEDFHSIMGEAEDANLIASSSVRDLRRAPVYKNADNRTRRFALNFSDVVRVFYGNCGIPVEVWVTEFEEMSTLMEWDQRQMLVFARKSLKGLAELFINGERQLTSWAKLRDALLDEFSRKMNSADIHKLLSERKMKKSEDVHEYFYVMRDIAAPGNVEDSALIQYITNGIRDLHVNKAMLYGAKNLGEFREKLRTYELFMKQKKTNDEKPIKKRDFRDKLKACEEKKLFTVTKIAEKKYSKSVTINGRNIVALIDTVSDLTLMREDVYRAMELPELKPAKEHFVGIDAIGYFEAVIVADNVELPITVTVASKKWCPPKFVIGADFLAKTKFRVNNGELFFESDIEEINESSEEALPEIFQINVIYETHDEKIAREKVLKLLKKK